MLIMLTKDGKYSSFVLRFALHIYNEIMIMIKDKNEVQGKNLRIFLINPFKPKKYGNAHY